MECFLKGVFPALLKTIVQVHAHCLYTWEHLCSARYHSFEDIQGFPKVDYSGIDARTVLEQNRFSKKKLPLTGLEPLTMCGGFLPTVLIPMA